MYIQVGDDGRYSTKWIGSIPFKREMGSHPHLKDVMYLHRLKKNLISIFVLEDRGYEVVFSKHKAFVRM